MKKRMLITGISGLLGSNVAFCLKDLYDITGIYHSHKMSMDGVKTEELDLTAGSGLADLIARVNPDILVHCAANANVDTCEVSPSETEKINVIGTRNVVKALNGSKTKLVYISTDLVYDGGKGNFSEKDAVHPLNYYGQTKCRAEKEASKIENALILRTNFWGWNIQEKYSLGEWVINELTQKRAIQGFTDCIFSAIYTFEFAKILDLAIRKSLSGIYNCASSTSMSKYDFVLEIAKLLQLDTKLINAISIDDFVFKARRGKNLSLDISKLEKDLAVDLPPVSYSINRFVEDFKKGLPVIIKSCGSFKLFYPGQLDIIPYGRQSIDDEDIAAVVKILKSRTVTQGPVVNEFESALCQVVDSSYAIAVNSGTSALHIACLAAGIGPSDEVITSSNTFVASANCVVYCGGRPVFADIDPRTYNISPQEIEQKMTERTKAVIPVHFAGQSCDMEAIQRIVRAGEKKYGHKIYIIEDACHALGSYYKKTPVGSCAYSDMAVMSFHPVKHITTGEGGVVFTNDQALRRELCYLRSHGITSDPDEFFRKENAFEQPAHEKKLIKKTWYYEQICLGYNYRMTEFQSALGMSQLKKLEQFRSKRRNIVNRYNEIFGRLDFVTTPYESNFCDSNFHLYVLLFDFDKIGICRAKFMLKLKARGMQTQVHYIPVHTQPFYRKNFGTQWGDCPLAERYYQQCLSIPLFPVMTDDDINQVVSNIKELIKVPVPVDR